MEIYKVVFKDKTSITVEADDVSQAIIEAETILSDNGIKYTKVDSVWSLVYIGQFL